MDRMLYGLSSADGVRHYSPHVWKIIMALKHKGLDFSLEGVSFKGIGKIGDGSMKSVPVLRDGSRLIGDSFAIASYLEDTYVDAPSLFEGEGAKALCQLLESYCKTMLHPALSAILVLDMYELMSDEDREHFRQGREKRFGMGLEEIHAVGREKIAGFAASLATIRDMLGQQPWFGGQKPLFADYMLFGTLQWHRVCATTPLLAADDPVQHWFERCLDLHDGFGRRMGVVQ